MTFEEYMASTLKVGEYRNFQWGQVEQYINGVDDGSIITGEEIKLAVKKFRADAKDPRLQVRTKEVDKVFEFFAILNSEFDGEIIQFKLLPFQAFIIAAIFGPYWVNTDRRKYREVFIYMARGGGKTTFVAGLEDYFIELDGDPFPEVILIAHSKDQAKRALDAMHRIITNTPELYEDLGFNRNQIYKRNGGPAAGFVEIVPAQEASLQGYKLTSCVLDEIHTYNDNKLYTAAKKGVNKKKNGMLFMISTAGDKDKTFCKERIEYGQKVLRGEVNSESVFPFLYMLDKADLKNWHKEEVWYKANPSLGVIKSLNTMREDLEQAKYLDTEKYDFLTYDLNVYTDAVTKWIRKEHLDQVLKEIEDEEVDGAECYVGADFSAVNDLTSIATLFWYPDTETFKAKIFYFLARESKFLSGKHKTNFNKWLDDKWIELSPEITIDNNEVLNRLKDIEDRYNVQGLGFDTKFARRIVGEARGFLSGEIMPIGQGVRLSGAIKEIQALVHTKKIVIEKNPVTEWNFNNVVIKPDSYGNWALDKNKSLDSIDGVVALCNAYRAWEEINFDSDLLRSEQQLDYWRNKEDI